MSELTDFLREKKEEEEERKKVDYTKMRREWRGVVDDFFNLIRQWLSEPEEQGLLTVEGGQIFINEEKLGKYKVRKLVIRFGRDTVNIIPIGRIIIGAQGRVDMTSSKRAYTFLYLSSREGWVYMAPRRSSRYEPLTQSLFNELLMEMLA